MASCTRKTLPRPAAFVFAFEACSVGIAANAVPFAGACLPSARASHYGAPPVSPHPGGRRSGRHPLQHVPHCRSRPRTAPHVADTALVQLGRRLKPAARNSAITGPTHAAKSSAACTSTAVPGFVPTFLCFGRLPPSFTLRALAEARAALVRAEIISRSSCAITEAQMFSLRSAGSSYRRSAAASQRAGRRSNHRGGLSTLDRSRPPLFADRMPGIEPMD